MCVSRLGRRCCFLLSLSLSSLLGVAVCLSSSAVVFLLLRLSQGTALAGVFLSSYIARECSEMLYFSLDVVMLLVLNTSSMSLLINLSSSIIKCMVGVLSEAA